MGTGNIGFVAYFMRCGMWCGTEWIWCRLVPILFFWWCPDTVL